VGQKPRARAWLEEETGPTIPYERPAVAAKTATSQSVASSRRRPPRADGGRALHEAFRSSCVPFSRLPSPSMANSPLLTGRVWQRARLAADLAEVQRRLVR
jgi:hypothetical protein